MSTIDQAFVQAFARRNRRPSVTTETIDNKEKSQVAGPAQAQSKVEVHWVDPAKDSLLRAEAASNPSVPSPHVQAAAVDPQAHQIDATLPADKLSGSDPNVATESPSRFVNEHTFLKNALGTSESSTTPQPPATTEPNPSTAPTTAQPPYISGRSREDVSFASSSKRTLLQPEPLKRADTTAREEAASYATGPSTAEVSAPVAQTANAPDAGRNAEQSARQLDRQRIDAADPFANAPHFGTKIDPTPAPIKASWEVDVFDMPTSVMDLFFKDELFQTVAERLHVAVSEGLSSMMVTSSKPGEGRSTVAIGMAVAAAATGIRVALVDGDTDDPTLVDDLRLDVDHGWRDALRSGMPLSQVAVYSIEDNLTLLPLMPQTAESETIQQDLAKMVQSLVPQFDLVIIDASSGNGATLDQLAKLVDSAVIARDTSRTDAATINELSSRLRSHGLQGIGIVENFA